MSNYRQGERVTISYEVAQFVWGMEAGQIGVVVGNHFYNGETWLFVELEDELRSVNVPDVWAEVVYE